MNILQIGRFWALALCSLAACGAAAQVARAASVAGVCPDGSMFIISDADPAPCAGAKLVDASDVPPIKPEYLARPYLWAVDRELKDETNPYNLVDRARALRELRTGAARPQTERPDSAAVSQRAPSSAGVPHVQAMAARPSSAPPPGAEAAPAPLGPVFSDSELRDLIQLVALRQDLAPATLEVDDARGAARMSVRFAYSSGAEARVREKLAQPQGRVVLFAARAAQATEFYPNFLVAQDGATFRPDPERAAQNGFVLGAAGALPQGELRIGYLVVPERFDFARPLRIWWNDRELEATLAP